MLVGKLFGLGKFGCCSGRYNLVAARPVRGTISDVNVVIDGLVPTDKVYRKYLAILPCDASTNLFPVKKIEDDWCKTKTIGRNIWMDTFGETLHYINNLIIRCNLIVMMLFDITYAYDVIWYHICLWNSCSICRACFVLYTHCAKYVRIQFQPTSHPPANEKK